MEVRGPPSIFIVSLLGAEKRFPTCNRLRPYFTARCPNYPKKIPLKSGMTPIGNNSDKSGRAATGSAGGVPPNRLPKSRLTTDNPAGTSPLPWSGVAGGGVASRMTRKHSGTKQPTRIEVLGLLARSDGKVLNLADFKLEPPLAACRPQRVIAVVGSSMNAGKTTTAGALVHGLSRAGFKVGAAKVTRTGSGGDLWTMRDAGAFDALDFTDAGHASTFGLDSQALADITTTLLDRLPSESSCHDPHIQSATDHFLSVIAVATQW